MNVQLKTKILKSLITISVFTILLSFVNTEGKSQYTKGTVIDKIIAKIDNNIILKSELEKNYLEFLSRGEISGPNGKCQILETLVINKLLVAKAEIDSVVVSDDEVESNLNRRLQYFITQIGSEEKIEQFYGKTMEEFKEELKESVREQLIVQRMQEEVTANIVVTPSEVKKFFQKIPKDSLPYFSTEVSVGQIVKIPTASRNQKQKAREQLLSIKERILNGEGFAALAKKYSEDPGSSANGGELGFWRRGELAPEYEATALRMKPGDVSDPVETQFGFHLIQLIERRGNEYNSRHILVQPKSSENDVGEATAYLDSLRSLILNDSASFEKLAIEYSDDKETAASGGFFLDFSGSNRVSVDELDPMLFFTIDTMQVGNISKPVIFKMRDGKQATRIIYYKSKTRPHQANLKDDYQKIHSAALTEKKNKALNEWFEKSKYDVFIDIDEEYDYCNILK